MVKTPGTLPSLHALLGKGRKQTIKLAGQPFGNSWYGRTKKRTCPPERVKIRILQSVLAIAITKATGGESTPLSRVEITHT